MAKSTIDDDVATTTMVLGGKPKRIPEPAPLTEHGPATVLAVVNQKGGVGKTTTTINLGASLAELGRRVLVVDFDPQGALSVGLGVNPYELELSVYHLLLDSKVTMDDVLLKTNVPGMDLLPSNQDLSAAEVALVHEVGREQILANTLAAVKGEYDVILIDCLPSLGLLTVNALTAADGLIVPLQCEYFALRGVSLLDDIINKVKARTNPDLKIVGILATMFDPRTLHSKEVLERIVEAFPNQVFETVIAKTVKFPDTTVAGQPITVNAPSSTGAAAYRRLARELIAQGGVR